MAGPLQGLRVADFSQLVQGPSATQLLGDLGADIVKIEPRGGEWSRSWSIGDTFVQKESLSFLAFNRAKRSITLDLKAPEGKEIALRIIKSADVLIENFRPGVMDRLGLGYETLSAIQPGLIYCASCGWGQDGPYQERPGQDLLAQSIAGVLMLNGTASDPPVPVGIGLADLTAGLHITIAVLSALFERARSGKGQRVDINLLNSMMHLATQELTSVSQHTARAAAQRRWNRSSLRGRAHGGLQNTGWLHLGGDDAAPESCCIGGSGGVRR